MEFPEIDMAQFEKPINPERVIQNQTGEQLSDASPQQDGGSNASTQQDGGSDASPQNDDGASADTDHQEEKLEFAIGNWDCLYGSWIDLNENQYNFQQDGTYTYHPYQALETEMGTYTVETEDGHDYLVMLSKDGEKKKYELSMVRAGIGLYSTEKGKETELVAYLLSDNGN